MGLLGFITSFIGGNAAKKASRKAEAAQLGYLEKGLGEQRRQFDLTRGDFQPYREAGTDALAGQGDLIGLNGPEAQAAALARLQESPELASLFRNGEEAVLQNASATGGLRGGNTQRGLADFRADTFARMISEQLSRLGGISGMGLGAAGQSAQYGSHITDQISELLGNQGQVRAGGLLTRGGINQMNWNNAGAAIEDSIKGLGKMFGLPF